MALKLPKLFGEKNAAAMREDDLDMPTTQVKMGQAAAGYDPLSSVSIMEQLRTASAVAAAPRKLPLIGHLPTVRQLMVLGIAFFAFLLLAFVMVWLDNRTAGQNAAATATATEMQMLSQRLARGSALASQGQASAFKAVRESRERFKADLDALLNGGVVRGVNLDAVSDGAFVEVLGRVKQRWERIDTAAERLLANEKSLTSLAKGLESINTGNAALLELSQQAAQQIAQGGGSLRELDFANQLSVLSQRIAKNANTLASSEDIDPEIAFLLGKDTIGFRDILTGLIKGSDTLRLSGVRNEEARTTLGELQKRFQGYETGITEILTNMPRLTVAKQAARAVY
ncbi:MAG TPA: type IV pili methyl-accepting chemotaxis transducer N-terminal domain-containing protein, partial [Casimicrobiaceae bacterium]|nr:type IV pili methyl-accepting chemotaxis transducer N-terminal domain-containing protein [Casimicrobiaceae bacterium]